MSDIDKLKPVLFTPSDPGIGFVAQPVYDPTYDTMFGAVPPIGALSVNTILGKAMVSNGSSWSSIGTASVSNTQCNQDEIKTSVGKTIDLNDLADVIETLKKRLLILTPNFEQHEKYPMLKAAYDEYKMLEKLLGDPE
jgi:hypothetical protein